VAGTVRVPIVRPDLGAEEAEAAARVVRSGWVMQGPEVAAFEQEFAAAVGAPHAVAVSSGTTALELALRVLDIGAGDEVVTVSHSFIATANSILAVGARPVFVDVQPQTLGMDPSSLALGPRTRAILCVHQLGIPCDLAPLLATGLPVIEDAACALGSETLLNGVWQRIGRPHGALACFSFHPRKVITTGEGGMITTANAAWAERLRLLRQHALSYSPQAATTAETFTEPAYNARMTDLSAAIGRPQLRRLDAALAERRRLAAAFSDALVDHPVLAPPAPPPTTHPNWQSYPVLVKATSPLDQPAALRFFHDRGVSCRGGLTNAHEEPAYRGRQTWSAGPLTVSEHLRRHTLLLPLFHGMTAGEEAIVIESLRALRAAV
jgi:perosamine synthetase